MVSVFLIPFILDHILCHLVDLFKKFPIPKDLTNILVYISIKLLHVHWKKNLKLVWARGVVEGQGLHRASQGKMEHQLESQFTKLETASRN